MARTSGWLPKLQIPGIPKDPRIQTAVFGVGAAAVAAGVGYFFYDQTMKPVGIASPSLSPPTVQPNAAFAVSGTFVDKEGKPTFAIMPKWYVYRLEGQSRALVAQGDMPWFSSDFRFTVPTTGFTDAEYVIVLSDSGVDIIQGAGNLFKGLPGTTGPSEIGVFNLPGAGPGTAPAPEIPPMF